MDEIYSYEDALKKFLHEKISATAYYYYCALGWKDTLYNWYYAEKSVMSYHNTRNGYNHEFNRYFKRYKKICGKKNMIRELAYKLWEEDKSNSDIHNWLESEKIINNNKHTEQSTKLYEMEEDYLSPE